LSPSNESSNPVMPHLNESSNPIHEDIPLVQHEQIISDCLLGPSFDGGNNSLNVNEPTNVMNVTPPSHLKTSLMIFLENNKFFLGVPFLILYFLFYFFGCVLFYKLMWCFVNIHVLCELILLILLTS
jgi:hypothetical protein